MIYHPSQHEPVFMALRLLSNGLGGTWGFIISYKWLTLLVYSTISTFYLLDTSPCPERISINCPEYRLLLNAG